MEKNLTHQNQNLRAFVSGYSQNKVTEYSLTTILKKHYPYIKEVNLPNRKSWQGYGFVEFKTETSLNKFLEKKRIRLTELDMNLVIKPYKTGNQLKKAIRDIKKRSIRVEEFPSVWDDLMLESKFRRFGPIENCYIKKAPKMDPELRIGTVIFKKRKGAFSCFCEGPKLFKEENDLKVRYEDDFYNFVQTKKLRSSEQEVKPEEMGIEDYDLRTPWIRNNEQIDPLQLNPNIKLKKELLKIRMINAKEELSFHQSKPTLKAYHVKVPLFKRKFFADSWNYYVKKRRVVE